MDTDQKTQEDVTIVLSKQEWNESSNAIQVLLNFAQSQRRKNTAKTESEDENSAKILQSIDTLFTHIFLQTKKRQERVDIYTDLKNLTSNEFENILDQLENITKKSQNKHQDKLLKSQFCQRFDAFSWAKHYKISTLSSIVNDYHLV